MTTLSDNTRKILDAIVESYGDLELSADEAAEVFGGSESTKVKDLDDGQLIQYALVYLSVQANDAVHLAIERTVKADEISKLYLESEQRLLNYKPNRAQRRAK